ncbi:MAG: CvpA family protein [Gammaproteobacteria bacterium]|nr:CvpA family protein [Gammaproteobacteria bacterium]
MVWSGTDIAIIAVIGLSAITGIFRGLVREVIALLAWIISIWLAFKYCHEVSLWLAPYILDKTLQVVVAFILILVGILLLGGIVNAVIGFILRHAGLSGTDRLLGMGFGLMRGMLIVSLAIVIAGMTGVDLKPYQTTSKLFDYFEPIATWMSRYVQPILVDAVEKGKALHEKSKSESEPAPEAGKDPEKK